MLKCMSDLMNTRCE